MNQATQIELASDITPNSTANPETQARNMQSFEALFKAQRTKLTGFIRKHIRNADAIDDIVSQTFLEAYRGWATFRGESKPETWLYGIALNIVRNNLARQPEYRFQFEDADEMGDSLHDETADDPLTIALRGEMMGKLKAAIDKLPEAMSNVVQMIILDGASYDEVAQELCIPVGTVRSRLARARETLKEFAA
jgi:RNA polymerase sigma factor (sigma-70 family)